MKRILFALILALCMTSIVCAEEIKETEGTWDQIKMLEKRGWTNIATCPWEFVRTFKAEKKEHSKAWYIKAVPAGFMNLFVRASSGVYDAAILPFYFKLIDDTTPITEHFDLPEYPWKDD